ncbi:MAG: hypothetical protein ACI83B_000714 [Sediminicola sp.]|jgi:hypothetical protein
MISHRTAMALLTNNQLFVSHSMKNITISIFLVFSMFSCEQKIEFDSRQPFKVNRNLSCDLLIENRYTQIFGEDVVLIGKQTNDTLVYYQIEYPIRNFEQNTNDSESNINSTDTASRKLCDDGTIYWRNYKLKLDSLSAFNYKNSIDSIKYKIVPVSYELRKSDYFQDAYRVVNLIDRDTFNCSVTKRDGEWSWQSSIAIDNY